MWQQREGRRRKRGRDRREGQMKELPWQQNEIPFLTRRKGVYLPGTVAQDGKGGFGEGERISSRPHVVSGPLPWMLLGVWFHISLGNDYLMEKLGALKTGKENENKKKKSVGWFPLQARLSWSGLLQLISLRILEWIITMWLCEGGGTTHSPMCT